LQLAGTDSRIENGVRSRRSVISRTPKIKIEDLPVEGRRYVRMFEDFGGGPYVPLPDPRILPFPRAVLDLIAADSTDGGTPFGSFRAVAGVRG
jgi:hypothetical protein